MGKLLNSIILLAAGAALLSCEKEATRPDTGPVSTSAVLTLPSEGVFSVRKWEAADTVRINGEAFALTSGEGSGAGTFEGVVPADKYFSLCFPADVKNEDDFLAYNFAGQVQEGNGSASHLPLTLLMEDLPGYSGITLSSAWAKAEGAHFRSCGLVCFFLTLPSDLGTPTKLVLDGCGARIPMDNAGTEFAGSHELALKDVSLEGGKLTAYLAVPEKAIILGASTPFAVTVAGAKTYTATINGPVTLGGDVVCNISVSDAGLWTPGSAVDGDGTEDAPYILRSAEDMAMMHNLMVSGETTWFELGADIDMKDVDNWVPLNSNGTDLTLSVHFDGKGHTVSNFHCSGLHYTSFFGALVGTVCNVTFHKPVVSYTYQRGSATGIIGGFAGTVGGRTANVYNVHITEGELTTVNASKSQVFHVGGLFGVAVNANISDCSFAGTITNDVYGSSSDESKNDSYTGGIAGHVRSSCKISGCSSAGSISSKSRYTGGIIGCAEASTAIERCWSTADVQSTRRFVGGIAGAMLSTDSSISNCWSGGSVSCTNDQDAGGILGSMMPWQSVSCCYSTAAVSGARVAGGIVGHACNGGWAYGTPANNTVEKCIAWNPSVKATEEGDVNSKGSSGCVIGFTSFYNTLSACYRRADIDFVTSDHSVSAADQSDCSPDNPFIMGTTPGTSGKYGCPYHGTASSAGVSALAAQLEWDTSVWDLSSDLPKLKAYEE